MPRLAGIEFIKKIAALDPAFWDNIIQEAAVDEAPPEIIPSAQLQRPVENDPSELLKDRFLCKGGTALLAGPTGIGKSSLTYQCALSWGLGRECFGIRPSRPLTTTIIQAENDQGDLAEMRDGVLRGLQWTPQEVARALDAVHFVCEASKAGPGFADFLREVVKARPSDLVILDPVFAYLGGDAAKQAIVSPWLRNSLLPVVQESGIGLVLVHHTNKPRTGEEKGQWQAGDYAYLGSGSAEFANFCRGVITLRSIGSDDVFELRAPKRGKRLGWEDPIQHIRHSTQGICWEPASQDDIQAATGAQDHMVQLLTLLADKGTTTKAELVAMGSSKKGLGIHRTSVYALIRKGLSAGMLEVCSALQKGANTTRATITLTEKGKALVGNDF